MGHSDRDDIVNALNLYGFAVDTKRWDLFGWGCWTRYQELIPNPHLL